MKDLTLKQENAPVAQKQNQASVMMQIIANAASDPSCDLDKMERLLEMKERIDKQENSRQFNADMAQMQIEMPSVAERGRGHNIKYATFEDINDVAKPIMSKYGFAVSFKVVESDRGVKVTGILLHRSGHREETEMTFPSDTSGSKNAVQALGSSISYAKRYIMCAMLNITTRGEDDDGNSAAPVKTLSPVQAMTVDRMLAECSDEVKAWFAENYGTPAQFPQAKYTWLIDTLKKRVSGGENANN